MNINIFDTYNLRVRLSVYIIVVAPFLITLYIVYEPIRNFSFSIILFLILVALSNYLFALQRFIKRKQEKAPNIAAEFLYNSDCHLDMITKKRYHQKLAAIDDEFKIIASETNDTDEFKRACESAVVWLRNNTRDCRLVQEENMLYGFYSNLFNFKKIGILSVIITIILSIIFLDFKTGSSGSLCIIIDISFFFFWMFGVNKKIRTILSQKYAEALLGTLDNID